MRPERQTPKTILLVGIALQLGFLGLFLVVFWWFILSLQRSVLLLLRKVFVGVTAAVALVTVLNAYRCAEFAQGHGGLLSSKEVYFFAGESILMLVLCLVVFVSYLEDPRVSSKLELRRDSAPGKESSVFDMSQPETADPEAQRQAWPGRRCGLKHAHA
jgi:RTA1 like protein